MRGSNIALIASIQNLAPSIGKANLGMPQPSPLTAKASALASRTNWTQGKYSVDHPPI
jgi:hypothetical protein